MRQTPGSSAARNLVGLIDRFRTVRAIGLERDREAAVPQPAFDVLAGEGLRMTAQHLRDLVQPRPAAMVVATVLIFMPVQHEQGMLNAFQCRRTRWCRHPGGCDWQGVVGPGKRRLVGGRSDVGVGEDGCAEAKGPNTPVIFRCRRKCMV